LVPERNWRKFRLGEISIFTVVCGQKNWQLSAVNLTVFNSVEERKKERTNSNNSVYASPTQADIGIARIFAAGVHS